MSTTNSSQSAYCRFKYGRHFFSRFNVGKPPVVGLDDEALEVASASGQLQTKALLSCLRHKTVEKGVEKCEFIIRDGDRGNQDEDYDEDTLESRLIVRLHCKHGVVKTHRLLLQTPTALMAPRVPDDPDQSKLTINAKALREIVEHFPFSRGKSDPQLVWCFDASDVHVKSINMPLDSKGKVQLATELTVSADEFERYDICRVPTTISFHFREFNATIAFAEGAKLPVEISFTDSASPLFMHIDSDLTDTLFVISTTQNGAQVGRQPKRPPSEPPIRLTQRPRKRALEEDTIDNIEVSHISGLGSESRPGSANGYGFGVGRERKGSSLLAPVERKTSDRLVQEPELASTSRELYSIPPEPSSQEAMPPPSMPPPLMRPPSMPLPSLPAPLVPPSHHAVACPTTSPALTKPKLRSKPQPRNHEPLFLPSSQPASQAIYEADVDMLDKDGAPPRTQEPLFLPGTQLSQAAEQALRESGLGDVNMTQEDLAAMLEDGDDISFELDTEREGSLDIVDELEPTPHGSGARAFRPLFED